MSKRKHSPAPIKKGGHTATGTKTNRNGNPINNLTKALKQTAQEYDAARIPSMKRGV